MTGATFLAGGREGTRARHCRPPAHFLDTPRLLIPAKTGLVTLKEFLPHHRGRSYRPKRAITCCTVLYVPCATAWSSDPHLGQLGGDRACGVTKPPLPNQPAPVARERLATTPADSVSKHLRRSPMYIWVLLAPCSHFSAGATVPGKHAAMTRPGWGQQLQLDGEP